MTEQQLQEIKKRTEDFIYGFRGEQTTRWFANQATEDIKSLLEAVEQLQQIENGIREENQRLRDELEVIANHNIFKVPQIMVRDFAREALKTKYRTPEENAVIDRVIANLNKLEGEKP